MGMQEVILIVEDETLIALSTALQLKKAGFEVQTVVNGENALELIAAGMVPDLILMDIDLGGGLDGTQTARQILLLHKIPILFLSSHAEEEIVHRTQDIAGYGYVLKNSAFGILLASIRMAFKLAHLRNQEDRYELLFQNMTSGFALHEIILNDDGKPINYRFLEINPAFEELTGLQRTKIVGKTVREVLPGIEDSWIEQYGEVASTGNAKTLVSYTQTTDKHYKVHAFCPKKGQFAVIFNDVTDLVKTNDELRESRNLVDQFFGLTLELLCVADTSGTFIKLNPQWEKTLGYPLSELEGRKFLDFIHPDDLEGTLNALKDLSSGRQVINFVNRFACKGRTYKYIEWQSHASGTLIYAAARDITARIAMEKSLAETLEEKKMLIREMQHRIKNNLLTISSLLALEQDRVTEPKARMILEDARNRIGAMMLVYGKLYQNDDQASLSLDEYLLELAGQIHENFNSGWIELKTEFEPIKLDSKRAVNVGIIVNEIITNSYKYAFEPRTRGLLTLSLKRKGAMAEIFCSDSGRGFPRDFEKKHADSLGMILMQSKAAEMNGTIRFFNQNGACCLLEFPF